MNLTDIPSLEELLRLPKRVLLVPHRNPDGDAMGACLGLYHLLRGRNHAVTVVSPNEFPDFLKWMPGADDVVVYEKQESEARGLIGSAEVVFTLDFNTLERIGPMAGTLRDSAPSFVMIDHHQSPDGYAQVTFSDPGMSSTCEMVYHVIQALGLGDSVTPAVASCLYTGILTDTGSFKYAATTPVTMRVAAALMERGAPHTEIHRNIYDTNRPERLQLLGCALQNLVILKEYRTAYITLSQDELDRYGFHKGDTEGFVNYGLSLEGVVLAAIFIENRDEGIIKISFRSQGEFSVNALARAHFEGGGHINAAGGRSAESLRETVAHFVHILPEYQKALLA